MNLQQFDSALAGLVNGALVDGVSQGKMDVHHIISSLELTKLSLVRKLQDVNAEAEAHIVKIHRLPPQRQ